MTIKAKKVLSILLGLALMLSLVSALGVTAYAQPHAAASGNADEEKTDELSVTVEDPLAAEKTAAKEELDTLLAGMNEDDYYADDWTALTAAVEGGKIAIDAMKTAKGIETAKNTASEAVAAILTKTQKPVE